MNILLRRNLPLIFHQPNNLINGLILQRTMPNILLQTQFINTTTKNIENKNILLSTAEKQNKLSSVSNNFSTHIINNNDADDSNVLKKLAKKFGWGENSRTRLRVASYLMYQSVADKINYKEFFDQFNLPNTFNSWFLVTELHVWMLMTRAMAEGSETDEDGRFMRNCIVEAMWSDVNARTKKLGSQNPGSVRSQVQILSQQFQAALIAYDEGLCSDDKVLASALWRRFFEMNCDDYEHLEAMVVYVRKQIGIFDAMSRQQFTVRPKIEWTFPQILSSHEINR